MSHMGPYKYSPLDEEANDIRIVELLPGCFEDEIHLKIHHAPMSKGEPKNEHAAATTLAEVETTLPAGWGVAETLEGRFLFVRNRQYTPQEAFDTTWKHPITGLELYSALALPAQAERPEHAYEALSYVWGSEGHERVAYVHDSGGAGDVDAECLGTLSVRPNLHIALQHLRLKHESRLLWVDAICINQTDLDERERQVQRIGQIYKTAYCSIIW